MAKCTGARLLASANLDPTGQITINIRHFPPLELNLTLTERGSARFFIHLGTTTVKLIAKFTETF